MLCKNPYTFGTFSKNKMPLGFTVPCGDCISCRVNYARFWLVRCYFESLDYLSNLFITLTYNDDNLPSDGRLSTRDVQLFFKRYRKAISPSRIRYFCAGEYGPNTKRPHYHAIIFNGGFNHEKIIEDSWGKGFVQVKILSGTRHIMYCCKYNLKSRRDSSFDGYGSRLFVSRRPGIGHSALDFFKKIYNPDLKFNSVMIGGKRFSIPPYYLSKFISDSDKEVYIQKNSQYFLNNRDDYFRLTSSRVASIEAKSKLTQRKDL